MHAGTAQQSVQRKGRMERRHQQLRAKQRLRPAALGGEAARARSSSSASTAFIPEGILSQVHLHLREKVMFCPIMWQARFSSSRCFVHVQSPADRESV